MNARDDDVIIVGGGPVGVALAVELGQRGISCAVVERHREIGRVPKGQYLSPRTVEHFYFWNCLDELRGARLLPPGYPTGGIRAYGSLAGEHWRAASYHEDRLGLFFQHTERLPQYLTEEVLRARASSLPCVRFLFGRTASRIEQDGDGVRVTVGRAAPEEEEGEVPPAGEPGEAPPAGGGAGEVLTARYAVGCDGARSLVRRELGIGRHGTDLHRRMVLAVFSSPQLHERLKRFSERSTYQVIDPALEGVWQFFGRVRLGVSWFYHGPVPEGTSSDDRACVHRAMQRAAGFSFPADFEHIGFWDLRADVAGTFGHGRVFIAGDAAHSHPPYGAYGLNSGLEDVTNLGWKLAAVLGGWGGGGLLDSYTTERRPVCVQTAEDVIMGGILRDREWLSRHDPRRDGDGFAGAWHRHSAQPSEDYEPHYAGSPIVAGLPGGVSGVHARPSPAARAGHHLASRRLSDGAEVYRRLGPGFTLLAFGPDPGAVGAFGRAARTLGVPLRTVRDVRGRTRDTYGASLVLVRPDQYVAWAGDSVPPDVGAVLARVTGAG